MQKKQEADKIIEKYLQNMRVLACFEMFGYYRYTRRNQESNLSLKRFDFYENKYQQAAKSNRLIVEKMLQQVAKKSYPLLDGHIDFRGNECDSSICTKEEIHLIKLIVANNSNDELRKWLLGNATCLEVKNGKITYNG